MLQRHQSQRRQVGHHLRLIDLLELVEEEVVVRDDVVLELLGHVLVDQVLAHRLQLAGPTLSIRCMMTFDEKRTQEAFSYNRLAVANQEELADIQVRIHQRRCC